MSKSYREPNRQDKYSVAKKDFNNSKTRASIRQNINAILGGQDPDEIIWIDEQHEKPKFGISNIREKHIRQCDVDDNILERLSRK